MGHNDTEYDTEIDTENDTENDTEKLPILAIKFLDTCKPAKRKAAKSIIDAIASNKHVTISDMIGIAEVSESTIKRYLKEMQINGVIERKGSDTDGEWLLIK